MTHRTPSIIDNNVPTADRHLELAIAIIRPLRCGWLSQAKKEYGKYYLTHVLLVLSLLCMKKKKDQLQTSQ